MMKTATLATAIQRDLLRTEPVKTETPTCFACGRTFMPRPSAGDDNVRAFCSARCRDAYDGGWPVYNNNKMDVFGAPMSTWRVLAGPPGVGIGSKYYAPLVEAIERKRGRHTRSSGGVELIRPRKLCQRCGAKLPVWINGKQVRSDRKFCTACSPNLRSGTRGRSSGLTAKKVA